MSTALTSADAGAPNCSSASFSATKLKPQINIVSSRGVLNRGRRTDPSMNHREPQLPLQAHLPLPVRRMSGGREMCGPLRRSTA